MHNNLLFLSGQDVEGLLNQEDSNILNIVQKAYTANYLGNAALPESSFLRFPNKDRERIISLPAYLGEPFNCAGIKWISSFPDNVKNNMERASAIFVLNSLETGHPIAVMESSIISAKRTASGAALTASLLIEDKSTVKAVTVIGTGLINFETVNFLLHLFPELKQLYVYDLDINRSQLFKEVVNRKYPQVNVECCETMQEGMQHSQVITIATTAIKPYIFELQGISNSTVVLHTSLRDLAPEIMISANNVVDDIKHACSANTSLFLASQIKPASEYISCTIGELISQGKSTFIKNDRPTIVSPFGMGILDLALAQFIYQKAQGNKTGININNFIPEPWFKKTA